MEVAQPGSTTTTVIQAPPAVIQPAPVIMQPATTIIQPTQVVTQPPQTLVVAQQPVQRLPGSCPFCGGIIKDKFSQMGIIFAIVLFPFGIILCFLMMEKRCQSCGR